jgi:hypothetical protein
MPALMGLELARSILRYNGTPRADDKPCCSSVVDANPIFRRHDQRRARVLDVAAIYSPIVKGDTHLDKGTIRLSTRQSPQRWQSDPQ